VKRIGMLTLAGLLAFPALGVAQATNAGSIAARTELHAFTSLTLPDAQFLTGQEAGGTPVTIAGQLRIAPGAGPLPVVMMLHGSGGIGGQLDYWSRRLNEMGVSTFIVDSFTGRGLTRVSPNQAVLGRLNSILDAYRALDLLATHPRVDPARIVLMGFSRGGQGTLYASVKRFQDAWNKSGVEFAAYIPFYPDCATMYLSDTDVVAKPIRIFHGTPDDYNPVAPCRAYVERLQNAGRDARLQEYPNAHHGFDNILGSPTPTVSVDAQTVRNCTLREATPGLIINSESGQPFTYDDPCVERNPHTGYDASATEAATASVKSFLREVFGLP